MFFGFEGKQISWYQATCILTYVCKLLCEISNGVILYVPLLLRLNNNRMKSGIKCIIFVTDPVSVIVKRKFRCLIQHSVLLMIFTLKSG
jgi:hypothetical protein